MITKDYPDHHDAEIVLKLYELRREPVMRESRTAINTQFFPASFDDVAAVLKPDHPLNAAYRQTGTYWEMVYGMAKHGVLHTEFMLESCGEGLFLYARMEPFIKQLRETQPFAFLNAEWVAANSPRAKGAMELFRKRVAARAAAGAK
jgi:hypothetical protein